MKRMPDSAASAEKIQPCRNESEETREEAQAEEQSEKTQAEEEQTEEAFVFEDSEEKLV